MVFLDTLYYGNSVQAWTYAFLIIVGAFVLGKLAYWIIGNIIKKLTSKTKTKLDDIIIDMIEEPIMLAIIIYGIWYGLSSLTMSETAMIWTWKVIKVLIVINVAWFISRLFEAIFKEYITPMAEKSDTDLDDQLLPIIRKGIKITVWALAIIIALDNAGYDIGALLAGLGIGGLLLAMAAKDTVANIFGGLTIYTDNPFRLKDRIKISGFDGTVEEIDLRSTKLRTLDGRQVTIPNSTFSESAVENVSREPTRKVSMSLGLVYDTKPDQMEKAVKILHEIAEHKSLNKKHKVAFNSFGDFSLGILFIYYIKKGENILQTQHEINMEILKKFNKAKLSMAFPTQTIEIKK